MASETCFVIMAIGDQYEGDNISVKKEDLREKYNTLIKEAILKARPTMEVVRADEISVPGTMSTDIVTRIMHSTYVIADISDPNPNVFYELGLRHACKAGTIIIKAKNSKATPFDISHLRHIVYENTTAGLKSLSDELKKYFSHFESKPSTPDNHFLEIAKLTSYEYPNYKAKEVAPSETDVMLELLSLPEVMDLFMRQQNGEEVDQTEIVRVIMKHPKIARLFIDGLVSSGSISFKN